MMKNNAHVPEDQREATVDQELEAAMSPWYRWFLQHIRCPVFAPFGELDSQVDPAQNKGPVEEALKASLATDVTVRELPHLNHLFQEATTGAITEYPQIEQTLSPDLLAMLTAWIKART